ncbi:MULTISPECIES: copper chaperone PCu(A)C [Hyphomonas]|uniref:copper chaperone PCu(A)C n=1 Tax=Hyphomonas TaxID=85 RepID=UPI003511E76C
MRIASITAAFGLVAMVACAPAPETAESSVTASGAFVVKPAPGRDVAGGGLTLTVKGEPMSLVGAETDIADTVELHTMSMDDGVMRMRKVDQMDVTEDAPLELKSGGNHLMLFGVSPDIEIGETAELVLTLTDADGTESTLTTQAEIRGLGD